MLSPKGPSGESFTRNGCWLPHSHIDGTSAPHPSPPIYSGPSPKTYRPRAIRAEEHAAIWNGAIGYSGEGPMTHPTSKGKSTTNKPSRDDLLQAGPGDLVKMVADWLRG